MKWRSNYLLFAAFHWLLLPGILYGCVDLPGKTAENIITASLDAIGTKQARDKIQNLVSFADCKSPSGKYTTEIHSAKGGYNYFKQVYSYKPAAFEAVVENKTTGYQVGDTLQPLNRETICIIRAHEFHMMVLEVNQRFHDWEEPVAVQEEDVKMYRLKARDELNNECLLFFDVKTRLLSAIHASNPDKAEVIKTKFSGWEKLQDVLLPKRVDIDQGGKLYHFDFTNVKLNSAGFKQKLLKNE